MIRRFTSVVRFEVSKAIAAKSTWVTIALPALLAALTVWWNHAARTLRSAVGEGVEAPASAFLGFAKGASNGFVLGGILLLLYASMLFSNEGGWQTYKTIILRPHRRIEWVAGKFALLLIVIAMLCVSVCTTALALSGALGDYTAIEEEGFVFLEASEMRHETLKALALAVPPMIAVAAFGLMISTMTDHTGVAASAALGTYVILETAKESMEEGRLYLFNSFMPSLIDRSYFDVLRKLAEGYLDEPWEENVLQFAIATPLISAGVFLVVAAVIFGRRNFVL